jgi:hypothetical protein
MGEERKTGEENLERGVNRPSMGECWKVWCNRQEF